MVTKTSILRRKRLQVICLSEDLVFQEGKRRVIVPADMAWDDFFNESGIDIAERELPVAGIWRTLIRAAHPKL